MSVCFSCGAELPAEKVYRTTVCPGCGKGVRVCLNCKFYSPGSHWDCRETISEPVRDKDTVNFCDFFSLAEAKGGAEEPGGHGDTRQAFDKLFDS
jgi:predicted RNA-binding Zn-ribbon protein involved in translation (DUF1610 family)